MAVVCAECKTANRGDGKFCKGCGRRLSLTLPVPLPIPMPAAAPAARVITVRLLGALKFDLRQAGPSNLPVSSDMIPLHNCARHRNQPACGRIQVAWQRQERRFQ